MDSVFGSIRAEGRLDRINQAVRVFEEERQRGEAAGLERIWGGSHSPGEGDVALLAALVKSDLRHRFVRGESPAVAEYLEKFPELRSSDSRILSLIYEEYCLRNERGEGVGVESFCDRYPEWKDSLASQLQYHQLLSQAAGLSSVPPKFPKPGESFGEFELLSLLGTGGSSRVFLARDTSLGDRIVVLKVAIDRGNEPMILGKLVHPRIVWVNSVSYQFETQLRGLSMPYHPGLPLDEIVKGLDPSSLPRRARVFWDALLVDRGTAMPGGFEAEDICTDPEEEPRTLGRDGPDGDGWKDFPVRGSYPQGVAWIGRVLAEALHHAHGKQTFHRDIKPGNVLMTLSRGPQLLDFNLAQSPHSAARSDDVLHGGTLPYMAPEQIRAFLDPTRWGQVGGSADIYSLGLVLRELLTGQLPDLPDERLPRSRALADFLDRRACLDPSIRRLNPSVPYALEAIVTRCLAYDPGDRYPDASALAVDLGRFLERRPLKFARNPSRRERLENWFGRRRRLVMVGIAASVVVLTLLHPLPVEQSPSFATALNAFNRDRYDAAIAPLERLAAAHPESPLPKLFLALARDPSKLHHQAAEDAFRKAMSVPDASHIVVAWAKTHPEAGLAQRLDEFAKRCLDIVAEIKDTETVDPESRRPKDRAPLCALARQASELALEIDPGRGNSIHTLATYEESQGHFGVAYDLISQQLSSFRDHSPLGNRGQKGEKFSLLLSRSRIAVLWAGHLRLQGDPEARRNARELLIHAIADLDEGDRLGIKSEAWRIELKKHLLNSYSFRMIASLNLAEIDLELERIDDAKRLVAQASGALKKIDENGWQILDLPNIRRRLKEMEKRVRGAASASQKKKGESVQAPAAAGGPFGYPDKKLSK